MAKVTYYLGAGASYYACPILDKQAELMIKLASHELEIHFKNINPEKYPNGINFEFDKNKKNHLPQDNKTQILWDIGYFGKRAVEYNTIDTYAKKLFLNEEFDELRKLKMSVSIFFDLWENFSVSRYNHFSKHEYSLIENKYIPSNFPIFSKIDSRYKSLFSILLEKNTEIKINENFKFITWNYDLQLEETFNLFLNEHHEKNLNSINKYFKYKTNNTETNDVFHLNGYRGFTKTNDGREIILKEKVDIDDYWKSVEGFHEAIVRKNITFDNHIKYAWEHKLENNPFFNNIYNVLNETEILIVIGYSFPPFNRSIDQLLFSKLDSKKIKKIVYQDPNASKQLIENLFKNPKEFTKKIEILSDQKDLKQFYLPNEHFNSQETPENKIYTTDKKTINKIQY
ncbi:hypothetical protein M0M57_02015 [Flavobacterium azooxidireducens]|uniref:SIR2-like domain-containing protein n=1 Tax=Flavobacterium azooxidireducens TaxID=1871076 RepID=A0ABY4KFP5_9FLAO|nr:hypothetical protein [Flavobacterium azooxidireducens]UPQ79626.1 hypothetical protein M0M57_02015 [Flavobacterium azooxidireducens]